MKALLTAGLLSFASFALASGNELVTLTLDSSGAGQVSVSVAPGEQAYIQQGDESAIVLVAANDTLQLYAVSAEGIKAHQNHEPLARADLMLIEDAPVTNGTAKFSTIPMNVQVKLEDTDSVRARAYDYGAKLMDETIDSDQPVTFVTTTRRESVD